MKKLDPSNNILDEANAVSLMLFLMEKDEKGEKATATDLLGVVKSYTRIKALADRMSELGLVDVETVKERNVTYFYSLTEKGLKVADGLRRLADLISAP